MTMMLAHPPARGSGRLATPQLGAPLSHEGFTRLCSHWGRAGVWLSMWDVQGECVSVAPSEMRLWKTLSDNSGFLAALSSIAGTVMQQAEQNETSADRTAAGPFAPDIAIIAAPVCHRRRVRGAILGVIASGPAPGEGFQRLCDRCELDAAVMASFFECAGRVGSSSGPFMGELLALTVNQALDIDGGRLETTSLARNLDSTYEELNLIYRVSAQMGLPQFPIKMLEQVGKELVQVSRASSIGFVLPEFEKPSVPPVTGPGLESSLTERVVQTGNGAPTLDDLVRIVDSLEMENKPPSDYYLLNDTSASPQFAWSQEWLSHLVALPLRHSRRISGVMLAVNCDDGSDFTSVDVQLLRAVADRVTAFLENQRLYDDLADLLMGLLHALVNSIDAKDPYTCGHSERVAYFSQLLADQLGLSPVEQQRVYLAGLLHDVGKIGVPDAILCKPGKLTEEEFTELRRHPEIGVRILSQIRQIRDLMPGVLHHHERMDGRGYPHGLAGKQIPELGRIVCLADCFDAMTTSRTYRAALPLQMAIAEIRRCAGTQFDPEMAEAFLRIDLASVMAGGRAGGSFGSAIAHMGGFQGSSTAWPKPQDHGHWGAVRVGE